MTNIPARIYRVRAQPWRVRTALALIALWALSLVLYRDALGLLFFFDDIIHIRWLDWHSPLEIWQTAAGLPYYRPLVFSTWKTLRLLMGAYDPFWFHAVSLLTHLANVGLVYLLAQRVLGGSGRRALVAGALFAVYPFNYASVPWVGAFHYPLGTLLVLIGLLLYWHGRDASRGLPLAASWISLFLAPFAVQSAALGWVLVLAVEIVAGRNGRLSRRVAYVAPYLLANLLYLAIWSQVPKDSQAQLQAPETLWQTGSYFLQALLFPISAVATRIQDQSGLSDLMSLAVVWGVSLPLLFVWFRRRERDRSYYFAITWFLATLLVPWLFLGFNYAVSGARLFYLASVGSALLWSEAFVLLSETVRRPAVRAVFIYILLILTVLKSGLFIAERMELYRIGADLTAALVRYARTAQQDERLLVVNLPSWLTPKDTAYVVGHEGYLLVASYYRLGDFIYANGGPEREAVARTFPDTQREWKHYHGFLGQVIGWESLAGAIRESDRVLSTEFLPTTLRLRDAGRLEAGVGESIRARFGESIVLEEAHVAIGDEDSNLILTWRADQTPDGDPTAFLHLYDREGQLALGWDGYPLLQLFPFRHWRPGDRVQDRRHLSYPADGLGAGTYTLALGLYDRVDGLRLVASGPEGSRYPADAVVLAQIRIN